MAASPRGHLSRNYPMTGNALSAGLPRANLRRSRIKYFAVRDKNSKYLGTLEVGQDITDIKKIEGEKRLLEY
jgi:hypothetical protein